MIDKQKLINSLNERIKCYERDKTETDEIRIKELQDLLYVINKGCFDIKTGK